MKIPAELLTQIMAHARTDMPRESCGLLVSWRGKLIYHAALNIAEHNEHFIIAPQDYAAAEDVGQVVAVVHSHPFTAPEPSPDDRVGIEKTQLPWLIVNPVTGAYTVTEPSGYEAPLEGRQFSHGVLDCLTLIQDYYRREMGITLKDYPREFEWWLRGKDYYTERFEDCGFVRVSELQIHDVILMRVSSPVPNHGAIYLGNNRILHHVQGRLSCKEVYGGWWQKMTTGILRHGSLVQEAAA